jgi:excisionase family DNA binding protein
MPNTHADLLLIEEVAQACRAPVGTVRHWIRTERLPSIRPGRRRLVRRSDLEQFLADANPTTKTSRP